MKTAIKLLVLCVVLQFSIFLGDANSQGWGWFWSNNGGGWLLNPSYGWHLAPGDKFTTGHFISGLTDELFTANAGGSAAVQILNSSSGWNWNWSNNGNGWIGPGASGWHIGSADRYIGGSFNGGSLFATNALTPGAGWASLIYFLNGTATIAWMNGGNNTIGPWTMGSNDKYTKGNIFVETGNYDDLLCTNTSSAQILSWSSSGWVSRWSNVGNGTIGNWTIHANDVYKVGKFDGSGLDEVLFVSANGSSGVAMLQYFDGTIWHQVWSNSSNGFIGSWLINSSSTDNFVVANVDVDSKSELVSINASTGWEMVQKYDAVGGGWVNLRSNLGSFWIGAGGANGWHIGSGDIYLPGYYYYSSTGKDRVFVVRAESGGWATLMEYFPPPVISDVSPEPAGIYWGQTSTVTCDASSPDNLSLTYSWSNNGGGSGYTATPNGNTYSIHNISHTPTTTATAYVTVSDPYGGSAPGSADVTLLAANPPGGGHGCPYVFSWDGTQLSAENNILPQCEYPGNKNLEVSDFYKLLSPPMVVDGEYRLKIGEFENERSFFSGVRLIAIDHPGSTEIAVLPGGRIVQYASPYQIESAELDNRDFGSALERYDKTTMTVKRGSHLDLKFKDQGQQTTIPYDGQGGVLLGGYFNKDRHEADSQPIKKAVGGSLSPSVGSVGEGRSFTFREKYSLTFVPLDKIEQTLSIQASENLELDYVGLAMIDNSPISKSDLKLDRAIHSKLGDISNRLSNASSDAITLSPGEAIELNFKAPPLADSYKRDFVLMAKGRYETIRPQSGSEWPQTFSLSQNYPNPFNPSTSIGYGLPGRAIVRVAIYDVLGQQIALLVDGTQEGGFHSVKWNASLAPSGVYFARLFAVDPATDHSYQDVKKLLLAK